MNARIAFAAALSAAALASTAGATDTPIALNYNFNGMVHTGEPGFPDSTGPSGFRSIADRAFALDGVATAPASLNSLAAIIGATGINYTINLNPGQLDMVMLGDRNINNPFETVAPGTNANVGIAPDWLAALAGTTPPYDQRTPQTTTLGSPIVLDAYSEIGILYHMTNVGAPPLQSFFTVTLHFSDAADLTITVNARDWFGSREALSPMLASGLSIQQQMGTFRGCINADNGTISTSTANVLNLWEAVIDVRRVLLAGLGDYSGKTLTSIDFTYPSPVPPGNQEVGIYAATARTGVAAPSNTSCAAAQVVPTGNTAANNLRVPGGSAGPCGINDGTAVWFQYNATASGDIEASTCGSTLDTTMAVYDGCAGALVACNDNFCGRASLCRWTGINGHSYMIRVAGTNNTNGSFTLKVDATGAPRYDTQVALNYNWNGMCHPGEFSIPDEPAGYRSMSDRGLLIDGTAAGTTALGAAAIVGATGITYDIVRTPMVPDMVMLGNRNTVDLAQRAFDGTVDGDDIGIQPSWLPNPDLSTPQTTTLASPILLDAYSEIGVLYNYTNGGGTFECRLSFTDASDVVITMQAPDWTSATAPTTPSATSGMSSATRRGGFKSITGNDRATAITTAMSVIESVIDVHKMLTGGLGDFSGKHLSAITFQNRSAANHDLGIYAITVRAGVPGPTNGSCATASQVYLNSVKSTNNLRAPIQTNSTCGTNDNTAVWYRYDAATTGTVEANTCSSTLDTTIEVFDGCGGPSVACNDQGGCTNANAARATWTATVGHSYFIRVAVNNSGNGAFILTLIDTSTATYFNVPLTFNWNGMVHGAAEQGATNRDNLQGYRSMADRGLLLNGAAGALNAAPVADADGMTFNIASGANELDIVHLGDRRTVANAARNWGTAGTGSSGPQPSWLLDNDQTSPQVSPLGNSKPIIKSTTRLGVLYQISDGGGRFDCVLTFTDNSTVTVTMRGADWFGSQTQPAVVAGSGMFLQRQLGTYLGTDQVDLANAPANILNVVEGVTTVGQILADGLPNIAGKHLASITFQNPVSNTTYPNSTLATGSGHAIIAATLRNVSFACNAADVAGLGGSPGADGQVTVDDLVYFLSQFFSGNLAVADLVSLGGNQTPDGQITVDDLVYFLSQFFSPCNP